MNKIDLLKYIITAICFLEESIFFIFYYTGRIENDKSLQKTSIALILSQMFITISIWLI